ncbi:Protein of unknown function [Bacillus mycoides]|nr:Protein of unknown function [Bacillus mycoides]
MDILLAILPALF